MVILIILGISLARKHGKASVQAQFASHLTKYEYPLTLNSKEPSAETIASWLKPG
jgi:hypothetical protein